MTTPTELDAEIKAELQRRESYAREQLHGRPNREKRTALERRIEESKRLAAKVKGGEHGR